VSVRWVPFSAVVFHSERVMAKLPTTEQIDAAAEVLEPYFTAVGKVAHRWNHMQEALGLLFCAVAGLGHATGLTIWHSLKSDLAQRDMLRAVTEQKMADPEWSKRFPEARDIIEMINAINSFSNRRNAAIHAPCSISIGGGDIELMPLIFSGNPNARKLYGKDIMAEFEWYERTATVFRRYASDLEYALSIPVRSPPWPDKPGMPNLGEKFPT
jgi:hypothetical protein